MGARRPDAKLCVSLDFAQEKSAWPYTNPVPPAEAGSKEQGLAPRLGLTSSLGVTLLERSGVAALRPSAPLRGVVRYRCRATALPPFVAPAEAGSGHILLPAYPALPCGATLWRRLRRLRGWDQGVP
jgi:hypothetical protein